MPHHPYYTSEDLMIRLLLRIVISLLGNALGLWVASLILDDMSLSASGFVIAVVIFTVLTAVLQPLITKMAVQNAPALQGSSALVTTFLSLVITTLLTDGLSIDGVSTWIFATVIVWFFTMIAAWILPIFLLKEARENNK
ncbi:MAG: phage holin family protein [Ilumatobacteraceae bacterium]